MSIPTRLTTRNSNFSKVLKINPFWAILAPINDCFWHFWAKSQILTWSRAQYKKCPLKMLFRLIKRTWKCQKTGGRGGINPPPSSTSLKYLRNERADQRFHLLISKFVTFWSWSQSQSLHKKQWLWLNKTVKIHVFLTLIDMRGAESAPPLVFLSYIWKF